MPKVKTAIYSWFRKYLGAKEWSEEAILVQMIFLHNGNRKVFEAILTDAIEAYKTIREKEIKKKLRKVSSGMILKLRRKVFSINTLTKLRRVKVYL